MVFFFQMHKTHNLYEQKVHTLTLREGVIEYLQSAQKLGFKIGLASSSSKKWVEEFLRQFDIRSYFEVIKTSDDVHLVKPDPELYIQAISSLGVEATEAIAFEDSKNGLIAALGAGMKCVIVPNPVTILLEFKGHSFRLESMGEMGLEQVLEQFFYTDDRI
jgi:putative hydrolase of the HAD superfamily